MKITSIIICIAIIAVQPAIADQNNPLIRMEIPSSPNPVGSGARASGMGGAFISIADDATAASWNPGGLIQLELPEISGVFGYFNRTEDNTFEENPESSGKSSVDKYNLNYLSFAYPFQIKNRNMIISLNYQHMYDFHRQWNFDLQRPDPIYDGPTHYEYEQKGGLYALALAYCFEFTPNFSAGITLNYWGDFLFKNEWEQNYYLAGNVIIPPIPGGIPGTYTVSKTEQYSFQGWNAQLGFLWKINSKLTIGGVLKTPFTADIDHTISRSDSIHTPSEPETDSYDFSTTEYEEKLHMPISYGIGISYRFSHNLTLAADIYRTHWDDFEMEDSSGITRSPISGKNIGDSDIAPTTWFRMGGEYLVIGKKTVVPIRAGILYDPAPAEGSADDYYGFSIGSGLGYERFIFDIAYQFRFGNDVGGSVFEDMSQDIYEHTIYTSVIIHF